MLRINGLYGHIQSNALKSVLLMLAFFVLVVAFWFSWCVIYDALVDFSKSWRGKHGLGGLSVEAILRQSYETAWRNAWVPPLTTVIWFANAYAFHDDIIEAETGAAPVTRTAEPRLYNLVENLAIRAGLPKPKIEIMPNRSLNAYASGLGPKSATIAVTRGLLDALNDDELEAVLAHEMTHIINRDVRLMAVATVFAGGLTLVGNWLGNLWSAMNSGQSSSSGSGGGWGWGFGRDRSGQAGEEAEAVDAQTMVAAVVSIAIAAAMLALIHLLTLVIRFALSRSREFMADAGSVELTKNPDALVSALRKISDNDELPGVDANVMAMMISGPSSWFDTHPSIEARISALQKYGCADPAEIAAARAAAARWVNPELADAGAMAFSTPRRTFGRRRANGIAGYGAFQFRAIERDDKVGSRPPAISGGLFFHHEGTKRRDGARRHGRS